jgi:hypothetical protein
LPVHVQLTTGDIEVFRSIARRMFGDAFPDVAGIDLGQSGAAAAARVGVAANAGSTQPPSRVGSTR